MINPGKYFKSRYPALLAVALFAMIAAGCGESQSDMGTLGVYLTDAPACGFDAVNVTVNKVRVHQSGTASANDSGWTDIVLNPPRKIDLLSLNNGVLDNLGNTPLNPGHYTQLRLVLDPNNGNALANSVVPAGGSETRLYTPSAIQIGIKLINQFDVAAEQRTDLVLDFNACKSIVKTGNGSYILKPVIRVMPFALNGIDGYVDPALLPSNVMVTAQQDGVVMQTTAPNMTNGEFLLSRLAPGDYDVVITADGHVTAVIASVPVATTTSIVNVSDIAMPITLQTSSTHTVSGHATLDPVSSTEAAYVAAKQTFGTAPTVTVKSTAADDTSLPPGAYSVTLPVGAPWFGPYGTTLPISLTAQSGVAAAYTIEASADGYQPSSPASVDISTTDATEDFTLNLAP